MNAEQRNEHERRQAAEQRAAERERARQALAFTRELEAAFAQHLADLGHAMQPNGPYRQELEDRALAYIRAEYGDAAAEHCARVALPKIGPDSGAQPGTVGGLQRRNEWSGGPGAVV